ncbi:MAG: MBOAT family protein, partial [Acidobacteria bacterium]|nr:MBOAT family protein [Acidobacteriota bacterium]
MIFHSLTFVAFFLVVVTLYWRLPHRAQNVLLLVSSYVFYGWVHPWFLTLIFASTVVDFWAGRGMATVPAKKKVYLSLSLVVNLGMLAFFKYYNFFAENVHTALAALHFDIPLPALHVVLPVGISFYTFQELSYTLAVYKGKIEARRNFLDFATFVCFFPQLVAGPIERAAHLLPQVEQPRSFSWPLARDAMFLILWGYFKKLVVADNAGVIANKVFALETPGFFVLWAGVFAFGIQIYADFSAYSDIARGTARWLGFDLMRNFNHPYLATGPADFWRRWHISLSSWFRDYVYIPLGGSRAGRLIEYRNIFATFLLSGFWHGANWNYVLWGAYHGALLVISRMVSPTRTHDAPPLSPALRTLRAALTPVRIIAMLVLTNIGWLLFRETNSTYLWRELATLPNFANETDINQGAYLFLYAFIYSLPLWINSIWEVHIGPRLSLR